MKRRIPNITVVQPINFKFLNSSIKLVLTNKYPVIITGTEETMILKKSCLFLRNFLNLCENKLTTAINEPMCKLTSIDRSLS